MITPTSHRRVRPPHVTLREMLLWLVFVGLACAALKYADEPWWWLLLGTCAWVLFLVALVAALVDRGPRQAWAIGAVSWMAVYGVLLLSGVPLPTSDALQQAYRVFAEEAAANPRVYPLLTQYGPQGDLNVVLTELSPSYDSFARNGHLLWALLFGYLGARLATWVYARRTQDRGAAPQTSQAT